MLCCCLVLNSMASGSKRRQSATGSGFNVNVFDSFKRSRPVTDKKLTCFKNYRNVTGTVLEQCVRIMQIIIACRR